MMLLVAQSGPLSSAIERGLIDAGHEVLTTEPEEGLFEKAMGKKAIVYIPFPRSLDGVMNPAPEKERASRVLGASNAPGVEVVVFVLPPGEGFQEEIEVLRRYGKPYVIVRTPPILEEIAEELSSDKARSIWVPREGNIKVVRTKAVIAGIIEALETEDQGDDLLLPAVELSAAELFKEAAELAGQVKVHAVRPRIYHMVRPIARWIKRGEPAALGLWDDLSSACAQSA